ncbi:hypothetical protein [Candidatus Hakubella thermalkaliphila]|uniref:hypothetical protein n=1 Tax=Candidatus Hakubella thermalkaliphila TaxID=2754717 RepID=UPI002159127D|nr:hypothetical protein [Candidatus Hakubella thermalkaliphila]
MVGAVKGYRVILVLPEDMSYERRVLLSSYGAQVVLTPSGEGMRGSIVKAEDLALQITQVHLVLIHNP